MTKPLSLPRSKRRSNQRRPLHRASARRLIAELSVLNEIGRSISSQFKLSDVLETIYKQTSRLMETWHFYIALYHRDHDIIEFPLAVSQGKRIQWPPRRWSTGLTEWMIRNRRPLRRNSSQYGPDIAPIRFGEMALSYLGVPIILGDQVLGVLSVQSSERYNAYSERDEQILVMIADQAAIAIANAQRYAAVDRELQQRVAQLEALEATSRDLNATLHLDTILYRLMERVCTTTGADAGMVCLLSENRQELVVKASTGYPDSVQVFSKGGWSIERGLAGLVVRSRRAILTPDVRLAPEYEPTRTTTSSQMTVPIAHNNEVMGVLVLESDLRGTFSQDLMGFVSQIADHAALSMYNARVHEKALKQQELLTLRSQQLSEVLRISQALSANLNLDDLLPEIVRAIRSSLGFNIALLSMVDEENGQLVQRRASVGLPPETWEQMRQQPVPTAWYFGVMRDEFRISRSYFIPHNHDESAGIWNDQYATYRPDLGDRNDDEWHSDDALFVPLYDSDGQLISVIAVDDPRDRRIPTLDAIQVLEIFANQAAIAIENAHLYAQTHERAITDGLTGLFNQAHFVSLLEREIQLAERYEYPLSLLALDLDRFKTYNDTYGHLEGNVLLREFSQLMQQRVRDTDIVARNGGEEFAIVLPKTDLAGAILLAERLRVAVEAHPFRNRKVTVSIGVAMWTPTMDALHLQQLADEALYCAKEQGRNSVATPTGTS